MTMLNIQYSPSSRDFTLRTPTKCRAHSAWARVTVTKTTADKVEHTEDNSKSITVECGTTRHEGGANFQTGRISGSEVQRTQEEKCSSICWWKEDSKPLLMFSS